MTGDSRCVPLAACERCRFIRESAAYKDDSGAWVAYLSLLCVQRAVVFPQVVGDIPRQATLAPEQQHLPHTFVAKK